MTRRALDVRTGPVGSRQPYPEDIVTSASLHRRLLVESSSTSQTAELYNKEIKDRQSANMVIIIINNERSKKGKFSRLDNHDRLMYVNKYVRKKEIHVVDYKRRGTRIASSFRGTNQSSFYTIHTCVIYIYFIYKCMRFVPSCATLISFSDFSLFFASLSRCERKLF